MKAIAVVASCAVLGLAAYRAAARLSGQARPLHRRPCQRRVLGPAHRDQPHGHHSLRLSEGRGDRAASTTSSAPPRPSAARPSTTTSPRRYPFDDTDVYKVIEGASYTLSVHPDPKLDAYVDGLIEKIAAAQEKDGYLYTARTIDPLTPAPVGGHAALGAGRRQQPRAVRSRPPL